jgi:peptidoglycan/xylan/chitin deacetylase (PgdA/CDA1 family)
MNRVRPTPVPILLYHSVSDDPPAWIRPFAISPDAFRRQLELIRNAGATTMSVQAYARTLASKGSLPEHLVLITFDDGLADFRKEALPALAQADLTATLFATTGFLEDVPEARGVLRPEGAWLDRAGLLDVHGQGIEIGAHSHTHPQLDTLTREAAREEIARPKAILEQLLGAPVRSFAYPHGFRSRSLRRLVVDSDYTSGCGVGNALSSEADDLFALSRLTVRANTSLPQFAEWLEGLGAPVAPRRERLRTRAWRTYRRSRAVILRKPGSDWS